MITSGAFGHNIVWVEINDCYGFVAFGLNSGFLCSHMYLIVLDMPSPMQCLSYITLSMVLHCHKLLEIGVIIPWREVPSPVRGENVQSRKIASKNL